ncbi:hypothetical protein OSTOST_00387 [Ostertagia ostertagi]
MTNFEGVTTEMEDNRIRLRPILFGIRHISRSAIRSIFSVFWSDRCNITRTDGTAAYVDQSIAICHTKYEAGIFIGGLKN